MIYCFDTYYFEDKAQTTCVGIPQWDSCRATFELSETVDKISDYESGAFYKRELPCIISVLEQIELNEKNDTIIIDGFVLLDDKGKLGLGGYLFEHLNSKIPIVGVAKNNFATIDILKRKVLRGKSKKPLYVTAKGIDLDIASSLVENMCGKYRLPDILKEVDTL